MAKRSGGFVSLDQPTKVRSGSLDVQIASAIIPGASMTNEYSFFICVI